MADMSEDDLLEALHQRMVTTGAWGRLIDKMRAMLTATSYEDELAVFAESTIGSPFSVQILLALARARVMRAILVP